MLPSPLFLLHHDPVFIAQLRDAAATSFRILPVASFALLAMRLRTARPTTVAVVDPYHEGDGEPAPALQHLLRDNPTIPVIIAVKELRRPGDLLRLGRWGAAEAIVCPEGSTDGIRRVLRSVHGRSWLGLVRSALGDLPSGWPRVALEAAAEVAARGGGVGDLARALHLCERTLLRHCEESGLPGPRRLLMWVRLLYAAELLQEETRSVESVASACGYACDGALRRALHEMLGCSPRELRERGAWETVAAAFRHSLDAAHGCGALG